MSLMDPALVTGATPPSASVSTEEVQHLRTQVRELSEELDRTRKDLESLQRKRDREMHAMLILSQKFEDTFDKIMSGRAVPSEIRPEDTELKPATESSQS